MASQVVRLVCAFAGKCGDKVVLSRGAFCNKPGERCSQQRPYVNNRRFLSGLGRRVRS